MEKEILNRLDRIIGLLQANHSPWLSTAQACDHLHISKSSLEHLIRTGRINPYFLLDGKRLFKTKELDQLIENSGSRKRPGRRRTLNLKQREEEDVQVEL
jgi:excisionase family DNA binding protein